MTSPHDLPLVTTIAVGLSLAFVMGMIASKLRIPPLVGYLLAGIIIGPHTPGFMADVEIAEELSEIGVVLLLFGVGLHFSIHDFMEVRKIASFGALIRIGIITLAGSGMAALWGWPASNGIIFGLALSVASTVVVLRTLEDQHMLSTMTGKISIGWLIVEDMAMILALILIPALAIKGDASPNSPSLFWQVGTAISKAILFAAIMAAIGRRVLPWLLTAVSRTGSRELFTLAVFAMAMGIAFGAALFFGVSFALGAFFAGMMIRESDLNHEVADRALPFQDAFAVLFFVAIGMLFNPAILVDEPVQVFLTTLLIIAGKFIITFLIVKGFRYSTKRSVMVAAGLAQIGEFSFILIALGANHGLLSDDARNLILAGAMISIALNPVLFGYCKSFCEKSDTLSIEDDDLAHLEKGEGTALKNIVILVGHGKVGSEVTKTLNADHVELVIIDQNRETVESLRDQGYHAIAGDAGDGKTLDEAFIEKAQAVVITVPDPFEARRIVETIQMMNAGAKIIVRSHNDDETAFFESQNVDMAVTAKDEIARRMVWGIEQMRGGRA